MAKKGQGGPAEEKAEGEKESLFKMLGLIVVHMFMEAGGMEKPADITELQAHILFMQPKPCHWAMGE